MMKAASIPRPVALVLVTSLIAATSALPGAGIRGFTPAQLTQERAAEALMNSSPTGAQAMRDELGMASYVHRMGRPGDLRSALYFRDQLRAAGWNANLVEYDVAIAYPVRETLTLLAPQREAINLYEAAVPGDPYSYNHAAIGVPFSGYSADGDVRSSIVYANYGRPNDYKILAAMHVKVRGAIILARVGGGGSLSGKAYEAAKHGAGAVLLFSDPMRGGYWNGDVYPKGPFRPLGSAMRNTTNFVDEPGDPTAIGVPVPGAPHKPWSAMKVPPIPETPVTGLVARELLATMDGPVVPVAWHPGFAMTIHTGGYSRAHFVLTMKHFIGPIWDVIATMRGRDPQQLVVVGGHRDAWTYGSVDPISGDVDMLQLGRTLGELHAHGWRPQRTIVIASWDGEETNLFGSTAWVDQHEAQLRSGLVAYINTDEVAYGPRFDAYATPDLFGVVHDTADVAIAPNRGILTSYWQHQNANRSIDAPGGGSDHEPFIYHAGLPVAGASYGGPFGTYHSAYDNPASLRVLDPGMRYAAAAARYTGLLVLRLANATYPDLRLGDLASAIQARIGQAKVSTLASDASAFTAAARSLDRDADAAVAAGDTSRANADVHRLRLAESAFFSVKATTWNRSLLYDPQGKSAVSLPSLGMPPGNSALDAALKVATAAITLP